MISSGCHRGVGVEAGLWLAGAAVWRRRGGREEWRGVVGAGGALGQAGG